MLAAVVQLCSGSDLDYNLSRAQFWIDRARCAGAELIALPENFPCMREEGSSNPARAPLEGRILEFLRETAKRYQIVLAGGTLAEEVPGSSRSFNTSVVVDRGGEVVGVYRKIHLFDIDLPGTRLRESAAVQAGREIVVADTAVARLGLSICYDLRFPELYRELVSRGAEVLLVPSAFTVPTGSDHWEPLLRARAIENQCFVMAAAQVGEHSPSRRSYGRSMIIDPWGLVLAQAADGEGIALAELDFDHLRQIRERLPALRHRRLHGSLEVARDRE